MCAHTLPIAAGVQGTDQVFLICIIKATDCKHMLHLVPSWQSSEKHIRLKKVMEDRPDLIASELSGLAFDSLQQCFR